MRRRWSIATPICTALAMAGAPWSSAEGQSGGDGTIYFGSYAESIFVVDEATMTVEEQIPLQIGIPLGLDMNATRTRFYVRDAAFERVEIIDIAARESAGVFALSDRDRTVRIWSMSVDPDDRYAVMVVKTYEKLDDRYEIGGPFLLRYDLAERAVSDTIPWPGGEERDFAQLLFSPDGELLYFFADELLVLETDEFTEVDRWDYARALETGMGRFNFGFPETIYEEPGFYTGLFRVTDPVQNRRLMGVARVDLNGREVDFTVFGPSEGVGFSMAPDRRRAYGLHQEVGNYEMWTFDLEAGRVAGRVRFAGRPRMSLTVSSNGQFLYVHGAGNTIDVHRADTFERVRTVEFDADMGNMVLLPAAAPPGGG